MGPKTFNSRPQEEILQNLRGMRSNTLTHRQGGLQIYSLCYIQTHQHKIHTIRYVCIMDLYKGFYSLCTNIRASEMSAKLLSIKLLKLKKM
jgi:hypothetical protein